MRDMTVTMAHGAGGKATGELIKNVFLKNLDNDILLKMEDSALVPGSDRIAVTTDSFVVDPIEYDGGDIGRLSVCGTVNDLLVSGAVPRYLTCGFIIEEGMETELLNRIVSSMADTAKEAGVKIVAGDTKVVEGNGGLIINTSGVGFVPEGRNVSSKNIRTGDRLIISGSLGQHHTAILKKRMNIENDIPSDNAPLVEMVNALFEGGINVHAMRDVTRGGLATVLSEMAEASGVRIEIDEDKIPEDPGVSDFCNLLGLDRLYMGNEGKIAVFVPEACCKEALEIIRKSRYGENAAVIGAVDKPSEDGSGVYMKTAIGGIRRLGALVGEGLPRIC